MIRKCRTEPGARSAGRLGCLLLGIALSGCATTPPPLPPSRAPFTVADFGNRIPVEVAILPPSLAPDFSSADGDTLRQQIYQRLIEKGYTPLAPEYVDQVMASAVPRGRRSAEARPPSISSLRAILPTEAFLFLDVLQVKLLPGVEPATYRIEARATLLDGATGATLYEHRIPVTYEVYYEGRELLPGQAEDVLRRFASRLIGPLPARRTS